jgi:4-amino-4-deoxy-L-arabinose transferase-like glycosyltransferase
MLRSVRDNTKIIVLFAILAVWMASAVITRDSLSFVFSIFMMTMALVAVLAPEEDKRFLLMTLLLAFLVRIIAAYVLHVHSWHRGFEGFVSGDDRLYSLKALKIASMWQGVPYNSVSDMGGKEYGLNAYTYFLAMIYRFFEPNYLYSKIFNCLLGVFGALMTYLVARKIFSSSASRLAILLAAFYPSIVLWSASNLKDALSILLIITFFYCLYSLKRKALSVVYICAAILILYVLKNMQALYVHALILATVLWISLEAIRLLKDRVLITLTIIFFMVYSYAWCEYAKPQLMQALDFMSFYQGGMCRADTAGYTLYGEKFLTLLRDGKLYLPGLLGAYIKGIAYILFSPFPWSINSLNQLLAYPQMMLWYCLLLFSIIGFWLGFKRDAHKTVLAALFVFVGFSFLAMWEGNLGSAFRHRDYFAPLIFIFASAGAVRIFYGNKETR